MRLAVSVAFALTAASILGACASGREIDASGASADCTSCHGAPPAQGAHLAHTSDGTYARAMGCATCHAAPDADHPNGAVEVQFGAVATKGVTSPGFAGGTCAVYCHGAGTAFTPGTSTTPAWTSTGGVTCGTCHTLAPTSGLHTDHLTTYGVTCDKCHAGVSVSGNTVDLATHVNGAFDAKVTETANVRAVTVGPSATPTWPAGCTNVCHKSAPVTP